MSVFSDLYLSTPAQAANYLTRSPFGEEERILHSDITIVELSLLWALLEKRDWQPDALNDFRCVSQRADGCMIHQLPDGFVHALSRVQPLELGVVAVEWASTPELATTPSALAPLVRSLVHLAGRAVSTGRRIFLLNRLPAESRRN